MANPTSITIGANTYSLVPMPTSPGAKSVVLTMSDTVGQVVSPFTQQRQLQVCPGADLWQVQFTLPPLSQSQAALWRAWFMQLRGTECVFQLGDGTMSTPQGTPSGAPVVDGSDSSYNAAISTTLYTKGWTASTYRLLEPGDYIQIGYRLYTCLDSVVSDANGKAAINIWPSLREQPADGTSITLHDTTGLFRLADNTRQVSWDVAQLWAASFKAIEVR